VYGTYVRPQKQNTTHTFHPTESHASQLQGLLSVWHVCSTTKTKHNTHFPFHRKLLSIPSKVQYYMSNYTTKKKPKKKKPNNTIDSLSRPKYNFHNESKAPGYGYTATRSSTSIVHTPIIHSILQHTHTHTPIIHSILQHTCTHTGHPLDPTTKPDHPSDPTTLHPTLITHLILQHTNTLQTT